MALSDAGPGGTMVQETVHEGEVLHACEECGFAYDERELAEACEAYCRTHRSCSVEITRLARHRQGP